MTFEEWWTKTVIEWEIPANETLYTLIKIITSAAWKTGHGEGSMETAKFMTAARKEEKGEG
jgi:hypothetical protein